MSVTIESRQVTFEECGYSFHKWDSLAQLLSWVMFPYDCLSFPLGLYAKQIGIDISY